MGPDAMIFIFWMLSFKPTFSLSTFTFIKWLFSSSSLSAIRVLSSAYLHISLVADVNFQSNILSIYPWWVSFSVFGYLTWWIKFILFCLLNHLAFAVIHFGNLYFPGGASGKEPDCQCWRYKRPGFDPWVGKIPWRRAWQPLPVFLPGESHGQRSLMGYSL